MKQVNANRLLFPIAARLSGTAAARAGAGRAPLRRQTTAFQEQPALSSRRPLAPARQRDAGCAGSQRQTCLLEDTASTPRARERTWGCAGCFEKHKWHFCIVNRQRQHRDGAKVHRAVCNGIVVCNLKTTKAGCNLLRSRIIWG